MESNHEETLQFKSKCHIKKKFNFAKATYLPNAARRTNTRQDEPHSIDDGSTLCRSNSSKFSLLSGLNGLLVNPPPKRMVIGRRNHSNQQPQIVQFAERIVVAKRNQVDQLRRVLSERKLKIEQKYACLSFKANILKKDYMNQSERLASLASEIRRLF